MMTRRDLLFIGTCVTALIALSIYLPQRRITVVSGVNELSQAEADPMSEDRIVKTLNRLLAAEWANRDLRPAQPADSLLIARRLSLALTGTVPSLEEIRQLESIPEATRVEWWLERNVLIQEGYGMTESAGVISINTHTNLKVGSVGLPVPGAEVRIAEDGEIQYRAGNVFQGYWNKPEKTAETISEDGWLRTGDVGYVDNQGYVNITGRLKDIIITAGGKNITPAEIENRLKFSPFVSDAVIIGDKRKYLTCLVMIDQENVEKFAQDRRIPFNNFASLCAAKEVQELIRQVIDDVNKDFARVEQIKDFRLIDILLTAEDDELTPTMKLKRSFVEDKHSSLIADMYGT